MVISLDTFLGRESSWHFALALPNMLIPLALGCLLTAHDSPRSLLIAGRKDDALRALEYYQVSDERSQRHWQPRRICQPWLKGPKARAGGPICRQCGGFGGQVWLFPASTPERSRGEGGRS